MRASFLAGAMAAAAVAIAVVLLFVTMAHAHDMGKWATYGAQPYLYGYNRIWKNDGVNCCKFGGSGDCQEYPAEKVKIVDGGYLLEDGEFIAQWDTSVSPLDADGEYRYYRCKHPDAMTHCFFVPPSGS